MARAITSRDVSGSYWLGIGHRSPPNLPVALAEFDDHRSVSVAIVYSRALPGMEAPLVRVEVHLANGLPAFNLRHALSKRKTCETRRHLSDLTRPGEKP